MIIVALSDLPSCSKQEILDSNNILGAALADCYALEPVHTWPIPCPNCPSGVFFSVSILWQAGHKTTVEAR